MIESGVEYLVAIEAADIIDPVASRDQFRARMRAIGMHTDQRTRINPILCIHKELSRLIDSGIPGRKTGNRSAAPGIPARVGI